ncbi:helicase [Paenibacillus thermotolerans]|uniref:helicase n=1 Tax=Paenibacillus thermotolerans TaxID=3027807 RepID=UPI002368DC7B|nr:MULTISPECIES: helicase [unclassified Paenibacillus]
MRNGNGQIYPNCQVVERVVEVGGLTKSQLIEKLKHYSILMNEAGERLLADDKFTTSDTKYSLHTVELTVGDLGFPDGATTAQIFRTAGELGLEFCPLELGPHLRLEYLDQPEGYLGYPLKQNQAPFGSITIATEILYEDDDFPKGFYLRRINGELWLRGYRADHLHVWKPDDHFIFCKTKMYFPVYEFRYLLFPLIS